MERLNIRYNVVIRALQRFKEAVDMLDNFAACSEDSCDIEYRMVRDSAIKRFELSVDVLWKYAKLFLLVRKGVERASPKDVFRACLQTELIAEQDAQVALNMVDVRNMTVHTYKEEIAEQIAGSLPAYAELMQKIATTLNP